MASESISITIVVYRALFEVENKKILYRMEIVLDENGNDITQDLRLIWMMETVEIEGTGGVKKFFVRKKQYRYVSIVYSTIKDVCVPCDGSSMAKHYRVQDENGIYYDIPEIYCVEDDKPRKIWEQGFQNHLEHISDQPKDVIKEYEDLTGIDLSDQNMPVTDGGDELWQEHLRNRSEQQGKSYGQVEVRVEFPTSE